MLIPQSLAYALVAHRPAEMGLYSALLPPFLYTLFGSSKDLTIGPTAILALYTFQTLGDGEGSGMRAAIMTVTSGLIQLVLGLLQAGIIVDLISPAVLSGFTSAAAITIGTTQIHSLLGIKSRSDFFSAVHDIFDHLDKTKLGDSLLGFGCIAALIGLQQLKRIPREKNIILWYICIGRNAIIVIFATILSYCLYHSESSPPSPFIVVGHIPSGLPSFPSLSYSSFWSSENLSQSVVAAMIGYLETVAISSALAKANGYKVDASQELVALGVSNMMVGGVVGGFPVCGSFSRSAVNSSAGVKSQAGGLITGFIVMLSLLVATSLFFYIPQASLAAVIITAVFSMIDLQTPLNYYRMGRIAYADLLCLTVAFVGCLCISIEVGILMAVGLSVAIGYFSSARPRLIVLEKKEDRENQDNQRLLSGEDEQKEQAHTVQSDSNGSQVTVSAHHAYSASSSSPSSSYLIVRLEGDLLYYNIEYVSNQIRDFAEQQGFTLNVRPVPLALRTSRPQSSPALQPNPASRRVSGADQAIGIEVDEATTTKQEVLDTPLLSNQIIEPALLSSASAAADSSSAEPSTLRSLIIDFSSVNRVDPTGLCCLHTLSADCNKLHVSIYIAAMKAKLKQEWEEFELYKERFEKKNQEDVVEKTTFVDEIDEAIRLTRLRN